MDKFRYFESTFFFSSGDRSLAQYNVAAEELELGRNARNFSVAVVRVVLRHRNEFHVLHSFLQTLIVLCVAFASFFFDFHDFSDRVMANAVIILVVATIGSAVQSVRTFRNRSLKITRKQKSEECIYVRGGDGWKSDFVRFRRKTGPISTF